MARRNFLSRTIGDFSAHLLNRHGENGGRDQNQEQQQQEQGNSTHDSHHHHNSHNHNHHHHHHHDAEQGIQEVRRRPNWFRRRRRTTSDEAIVTVPHITRNVTAGGKESKGKQAGKSDKLGTFSGVFVPTSLNVLSILMFLRFGFILGQAGIMGMMGMLVASYLIDLITTLSISAISTNGTVRGGGAYYLISRSLGPEFGGSIGVVLYLGFVLNTGMNAVGLVDCVINNYGAERGSIYKIIPESFWWTYLYGTGLLIFCTIICMLGSAIFAKASNLLLLILLAATISIPISTLFVGPIDRPEDGIIYTGLSMQTLKENMWPRFTKGAAGSQVPGKETYQDLFGILFPATAGIFAGTSMSGDLRNPSKSIPKGTLQGLLLTFVLYTFVIFAMGASIVRDSMYLNLNIIQDINGSSVLIQLGEFATSFFSALMGVIGSAKLLQALARDSLIPGASVFGQGTAKGDEPILAIIFTYAIAQLTLLANINQIASFVTMTYLMTFLFTNLACFLLKIGSAPNFRPSFHYFRWWTAAAGAIVSGATMFFVDGIAASGCVMILMLLFLLIHYTTPPKSWGDVSQSLIYHQVRKYLLRLRQEHVKFWRPQILLFVNDPRRSYKLIKFCNALKKGALYILGHIIVAPDFNESFQEQKKQQLAWSKFIDFSGCKAFVQVAISPMVEWGMRHIVMNAGLGGMRPNIAIMGAYNLDDYRKSKPLIDVPVQISAPISPLKHEPNQPPELQNQLPTDGCRSEGSISVCSWVNMLEDLLMALQINVAIAKGFKELELPKPDKVLEKKYIDLWPIQMSAEISGDSGTSERVLTTNFDTYTLILQLGCILHTVPDWKRAYSVRVMVFVEYETDVEEERARVVTLLENLRIQAKVIVTWLANGDIKSYEVIVNGAFDAEQSPYVDSVLKGEDWWAELKRWRNDAEETSVGQVGNASMIDLVNATNWGLSSSFHQQNASVSDLSGSKIARTFKKIMRSRRRRHSMSGLHRLGMPVAMNMQVHKLEPEALSVTAASTSSESEDSSSMDESSPSDSEESAASEGDIDALRSSAAASTEISDDDEPELLTRSRRSSTLDINRQRRASTGSTLGVRKPMPHKHPTKRPVSPLAPSASNSTSLQPPPPPIIVTSEPGTGSSGAAIPSIKSTSELPSETSTKPLEPPIRPTKKATSASSSTSNLRRPDLISRNSNPNFSSKPVPQAKVSEREDAGPTIMFAEPTIPERDDDEDDLPPGKAAALSQGAVPLSFNDLPSKAQHIILNEVIKKFSRKTAVIFTTLPSPMAGTWKSEEASVEYISALDVLCDGLPPTLLIHSNHATVTCAL